MVEECEGDGVVGGGGAFFGVFVCGNGMWVAGLGEMCWEVEDSSPWDEGIVCFLWVILISEPCICVDVYIHIV